MEHLVRQKTSGLPPIAGISFGDALDRPLADTTSIVDRLRDPGLQDIVAKDGSHGGVVRHVMSGRGPFVWVQDAASCADLGVPAPGAFDGRDLHRPLRVVVRNPREALWAVEEVVKAGLNVVGEVDGTAKALDFTATRRLEMFAQAMDVTCVLVRIGTTDVQQTSSAKWKWAVSSHSSAAEPFDPHAPGAPRWSLELLRARSCAPGRWIVEPEPSEDGREDHRLRVVPPLAAGNVDAGAGETIGGSAEIIPLRGIRAA